MTETQLDWPADLGYATLVGRFGFMDADGPDEDREPDITPATSGTVLITPSVDTVKYDGELGPMLLIKRRVEGVIDADGYLATKNSDGTPGPRGIVVPATDADVQPMGFTYSVRISLASSGTVASYSIEAPTGTVVDLAKATPVASSGGTVTVVDYTSAERAETAAITAVSAKDDTVQARNEAVQASQTATTAAGIADTRATDASTSASTAADILAQTQALGITVDTSVGTRVFVGDTMIHGDTGWRDIYDSAWPDQGLDTSFNGRLEIKRTLDEVVFFIRLRISDDYDGFRMTSRIKILDDLPAAFRQTPTIYGTLGTAFVGGVPIYFENGTSLTHLNIMGASEGRWVGGSMLSVAFSYPTKAPWPTSLPGTPA